jgi:predicted ATPase
VVITGGPGAGKTALLEVARRNFCSHVHVLPESASILFRGGFPRLPTDWGQRGSQRAIFHVQTELERLAEDDPRCRLILCDRGTVDGAAYWPSGGRTFWDETGVSEADQLARYDTVIHLTTPPVSGGYNHRNPMRVETAEQAALLDQKLAAAWAGHPRRVVVPWTDDFISKLSTAMALIVELLPPDCRQHHGEPRAEAGSTEGS